MRSFSTLFLLLLTLLLNSCGDNNPTAENTGTAEAPSEEWEFPSDTLKGVYTGKLNDKAMTLNIFYVGGGHATGYNIVSGNRRNLSGTYTVDKNGIKLTLNEPGDDKYDGVFTLTMHRNDLSAISGEWASKSGEVKTVWTKRVGDNSSLGPDFTNWGSVTFVDSMLTLRFESDGACSYEYLENPGDEYEQLITIDGSYESNGKTVVVNWRKSGALPKKAVFALKRTDEVAYETETGNIYVHELTGSGKKLEEEVMP